MRGVAPLGFLKIRREIEDAATVERCEGMFQEDFRDRYDFRGYFLVCTRTGPSSGKRACYSMGSTEPDLFSPGKNYYISELHIFQLSGLNRCSKEITRQLLSPGANGFKKNRISIRLDSRAQRSREPVIKAVLKC